MSIQVSPGRISSAEDKAYIEYLQDIRGIVNRGRIAHIRADRIEIIRHI